MKKAIFIDKDGTLIKNVPYNTDPKKIELMPFVGEGLRLLQSTGFSIFVVTNQSGIAHGYFDPQDIEKVRMKLDELLSAYDVTLDGFYFCPHHPDGTIPEYSISCLCRKPQPGLLIEAARDHLIDLSDSWMVGDILNDIEAGIRAGTQTILIDNDNETEWRTSPTRFPHFITTDFRKATRFILSSMDVGYRGGMSV